MNRIYTRGEIIDLLYSNYGSDAETQRAIANVKSRLLKVDDYEFIELCRGSSIFLEFIRKNSYYMKIR